MARIGLSRRLDARRAFVLGAALWTLSHLLIHGPDGWPFPVAGEWDLLLPASAFADGEVPPRWLATLAPHQGGTLLLTLGLALPLALGLDPTWVARELSLGFGALAAGSLSVLAWRAAPSPEANETGRGLAATATALFVAGALPAWHGIMVGLHGSTPEATALMLAGFALLAADGVSGSRAAGAGVLLALATSLSPVCAPGLLLGALFGGVRRLPWLLLGIGGVLLGSLLLLPGMQGTGGLAGLEELEGTESWMTLATRYWQPALLLAAAGLGAALAWAPSRWRGLALLPLLLFALGPGRRGLPHPTSLAGALFASGVHRMAPHAWSDHALLRELAPHAPLDGGEGLLLGYGLLMGQEASARGMEAPLVTDSWATLQASLPPAHAQGLAIGVGYGLTAPCDPTREQLAALALRPERLDLLYGIARGLAARPGPLPPLVGLADAGDDEAWEIVGEALRAGSRSREEVAALPLPAEVLEALDDGARRPGGGPWESALMDELVLLQPSGGECPGDAGSSGLPVVQ